MGFPHHAICPSGCFAAFSIRCCEEDLSLFRKFGESATLTTYHVGRIPIAQCRESFPLSVLGGDFVFADVGWGCAWWFARLGPLHTLPQVIVIHCSNETESWRLIFSLHILKKCRHLPRQTAGIVVIDLMLYEMNTRDERAAAGARETQTSPSLTRFLLEKSLDASGCFKCWVSAEKGVF